MKSVDIPDAIPDNGCELVPFWVLLLTIDLTTLLVLVSITLTVTEYSFGSSASWVGSSAALTGSLFGAFLVSTGASLLVSVVSSFLLDSVIADSSFFSSATSVGLFSFITSSNSSALTVKLLKAKTVKTKISNVLKMFFIFQIPPK